MSSSGGRHLLVAKSQHEPRNLIQEDLHEGFVEVAWVPLDRDPACFSPAC